jgi:hypothetical protein
MNNFKELLSSTVGVGEKLGLLRREVVVTVEDVPDEQELHTGFAQVSAGEQLQIIGQSEAVIARAVDNVQQAPSDYNLAV